jgi:nucleoside-diphosphate-sugar epimerase
LKTILLTGGSGFIGSHLLKTLRQHPKYCTYELVLLSSKPIEGFKTVLHQRYTYTKDAFYSQGIYEIDIVIHLAAFTPKSAAAANNVPECNSNISSLQNLINQLPSIPKKFIFFSTLDVYKTVDDKIISENSLTEPATLYGWSKLYGEKMLEVWSSNENIILQILRIGHIYGSGEEQYQKIIPVTIRKAFENKSPEIFTKGDELRSFLHVSDCVNASIASIELEKYKEPINIVSGRALPVKQIVQIIVDKINPHLQVIVKGNDIPVRNLVFDNRKMHQYLVKEEVPFEAGIVEEINNFC